MANLTSNPWSLTSTDPATAAITAATGLTLNPDGTVTITSAALTFNTTFESNLAFTVIGATNPLYNGLYTRVSGATGATTFVMVPNTPIPPGTAQSGSGTLAQVMYRSKIRIEDISWQEPGTVGDTLDLRDRFGNFVWEAKAATVNGQNRGKVFWVAGMTPITITSGIVLITVN